MADEPFAFLRMFTIHSKSPCTVNGAWRRAVTFVTFVKLTDAYFGAFGHCLIRLTAGSSQTICKSKPVLGVRRDDPNNCATELSSLSGRLLQTGDHTGPTVHSIAGQWSIQRNILCI